MLNAPTELTFDGEAVITWTDNATGETEYTLVISINEQRRDFFLPPDSERLELPADFRIVCDGSLPLQGSISIVVSPDALDLAGLARRLDAAYDCPQAFASPTPAAAIRTPIVEGPPALPDTGTGTRGGANGTFVTTGLIVLTGALLALGAWLTARRRVVPRSDPEADRGLDRATLARSPKFRDNPYRHRGRRE
jgi:hypothetical protein